MNQLKQRPHHLLNLCWPKKVFDKWKDSGVKKAAICGFASIRRPVVDKSMIKLGLCWPGSVRGWAGSLWGHWARTRPPPSCSPPRREVGLPGTRPVPWMCHPEWRTGALPPVAEDCGSDRGTDEDRSERKRREERSGPGVSLRLPLTWRFDGRLLELYYLGKRQIQYCIRVQQRRWYLIFKAGECNKLVNISQ